MCVFVYRGREVRRRRRVRMGCADANGIDDEKASRETSLFYEVYFLDEGGLFELRSVDVSISIGFFRGKEGESWISSGAKKEIPY